MRLYPAFRFSMGGYDFFVTKMNASEIAETVHFASDIFQGKTLSTAIQRNLVENRASKDIAFYWRENEARFFNSIVIAAWQGGASYQPIDTLESGVEFVDNLISSDGRMKDSFGILAFDGTEQYYALDGQHRVKAIKLMYDSPTDYPPPEGFKDDEFTVIIVPTMASEDEEGFRIRFRRMFSALNRYAKPTNNATNIVMDEDDIFAIVTRRLISDHPFFAWGDNDWENERVKTNKSKNLSAGDSWFTQIEVLYETTEAMLASASRQNNPQLKQLNRTFKQIRPSDALIEEWYEEVALVWEALIVTIPELTNSPVDMRVHNPAGDGEKADHLWFWPIGQQMVAKTVRMLLDKSPAFLAKPTVGAAQAALEPLGRIDWDLHSLPWRHLLLVNENNRWRMRSEGRSAAVKVGEELLMWFAGLIDHGEEGVANLKEKWEFILYQPDEEPAEMWQQIEDIRVLAGGGHL